MKRYKGCIALLLLFSLFCAGALAADSGVFDSLDMDYKVMKQFFDRAIADLRPDSTDFEKVLTDLQRARGMASNLSADGYEDSATWVNYIEGLAKVLNKDYAAALESLKEVVGQPGFEDAEKFIAYAEAMVLMDQDDMISAAVKFGEAGELLDAQVLYEQMTNPEMITKSLTTMMEGKQYDQVLTLIGEIELQHIDFELSGQFADYARGIIIINQGELEEALALFTPLADTGFLDSRAICEYIRGIQYHMEDNLELAIAYYLRAQTEAREDGVTQTDDLLDLRLRLNECQRKLYKKAEELYNTEDYLAAKEIFEALGNYLDSEQRSEKSQRDYDSVPIHVLSELICNSTGTSTLWIEWRDTRLGTYEITYAPAGTKQLVLTASSTQTYAEISGLFPNTEYIITVKAAGERSNEVSGTAKTRKAEMFDQYGLELLNPLQTNRYVAALEKQIGMEEIIRGNHTEPTDGMLVMPDGPLATSDYGFILTGDFYCDQTDTEKEIRLLTLIRVPELGTYGHVGSSIKVNAERFYVPFYVRLEVLLDKLYVDLGDWPDISAELEIYFDGALLDTLPIILKKQ